MPFHLPIDQAEALKEVRKISDLSRRLENRRRSLLLPPEQELLSEVIDSLRRLETALRTPPE